MFSSALFGSMGLSSFFPLFLSLSMYGSFFRSREISSQMGTLSKLLPTLLSSDFTFEKLKKTIDFTIN